MIVSTNNKLLRLCAPFALAGLFVLAGCGLGPASQVAVTSPVPIAIAAAPSGTVFGGQQAIVGASVQLYLVNTNGNAATPLLNTAYTTTSGGGFSLANTVSNYSTLCTSTAQVYVLATGGNPGAGTNSNIALMTAIGPCTSLTPSSHISVNEATTVAAVWALQQFFGVSVGTPYAEDVAVNGNIAQSATGMANAFLTANALVSPATGAVTANANATVEATKLYAIANILSACVNSNGSGACPTLFADVTPSGSINPGDTIQAALYMAQNPGYNIAATYSVQPTSPPFQPALSTAPFDWSLAITYTGSASLYLPNLLAADAAGNLWISNSLSGSNSIAEIAPSATPSPSLYLGPNSGPDSPAAVVPDTLGNIWLSAHGGSSSRGNRLFDFSPSAGTASNISLTSGCLPYALAIDGKDDLFYTCSGSGLQYLYEFPNQTAGTPSSINLPAYLASPTQLGAVGTQTYGMAIDSSSNVWVSNTQTSGGSYTVTEYASPSYALSNTYTVGSGPVGIAIDHNNAAWTVASGTLDEITAGATPPSPSNSFTGGGLSSGKFLAIDGAGNIWVANGAPAIVQTTANSVTTNTTYVTVSEFNNSGTPLTQQIATSTDPGSANYGYSTQPGGLAVPSTAGTPVPRGIAIDPSGNVWFAGCGLSTGCTSNSFVTEIVGAAVPPVTPLSTAVANNQLGCCSFTPAPPSGTTSTNNAGTINFVIPAAVNSNNNYAFTQNNGSFSFEITRTGGFSGALTINYTTSNGTAIAGTDYSATSGSLSWASGDSSVKTITVPWLHNAGGTYNGTKTFNLGLTCASTTCPVGYSPSSSETVTITDNLTPPSTHFAFNGANSTFQLTLPVDQYGGTGGTNGYQFGALSITPVVAAANYTSPYFYLNGSNQLVFTAPSNGATTSPGVGTNDTRSELREYYTGTGYIDSDDWDSSVGGTLNATAEVNATSIDSYEATIGQIHGQNNPFALLQYQPTSSTQGNIVLAVINTNTTNSSGTNYTIATGISLNTFFTYQLKLSGSSLYAYVNGASATTMPITVDSSWLGTCGGSSCTYDDGMYFKLGAYSAAPNVANPAGDQTQVTFSSYSISHP